MGCPKGILNSAGRALLPARRSGTSTVDAFVRQVGAKTSRQVNGGTRYVTRFEV